MSPRSAITGALTLGSACALLGFFVAAKTNAFPEFGALAPSILLPELTALEEVGTPLRLQIPAINVDAAVEHVGMNGQGDMDVPRLYENVAWYSPGTRPGLPGNAVLAGHLDSQSGAAVFWNLEKLKPGDIVIVIDEKQAEHRFSVESTERFTKDNAPRKVIFGDSSESRLNLITCGGAWDKNAQQYKDRIVVFTKKLAR